ncbi:MAG: HAMP domain-containing histidine kinase [Prevotella sp.]|nr:HAMP domain-containing histidine kinase [Prevotella sp.]
MKGIRNGFSRIVSAILLLTVVLLPTHGEEQNDSAFASLYSKYENAYSEKDGSAAFYELSKHMQEYYLKKKNINGYYVILLNEAIYDSEHGRPLDAIKKANNMMNNMKARGVNQQEKVYVALGSIYEGRGNLRLAEHYYQAALSNTKKDDISMLVNTYQRIAMLNMFVKPDKAREWNNKSLPLCKDSPLFMQIYYFIDACIKFYKSDLKGFMADYNTYMKLRKDNNESLDNYSLQTMKLMKEAADGNYDVARAMIPEAVERNDILPITGMDLRIKILFMEGKYEEALEETNTRRNYRDSLNSDMIFSNINEVNAQLTNYQEKRKVSKQMERMSMVIIVLALITIVMLAVWIFRHRKMRTKLMKKNEELLTALKMAEESDKMKTEFVRQVSHEIRTPLNAISGFNDVLNNDDMHLSEEERNDLVKRIKENTTAITDIVDEMLHLSDHESSEYYARNDKMQCNKVLSELLYSYRDRVNPLIELNYTTGVINRFTLKTNEESVKRILNHIVQNAIKFTIRGHIDMHCSTSDDKRWLSISVSDTGRGISPEIRDRIFDQFVKGDHFEQGIGLGLTVSRKIANKLGGDLTLDESYDKGSRFVLTLPIE